MRREHSPEIQAGSMADIAFLLLIFFLVTTTVEVDMGISRKLPPKINNPGNDKFLDKNVLEVNLNANNEIMLEDKLISSIRELRPLVLNFIDNGGGTDAQGNPCTWCKGKKDPGLSDHPEKAIITITSSRNTNYATYISVQNEIIAAYAILRNRISNERYGKSYTQLLEERKSSNSKILADQIEKIRKQYPLHIIEEDPIQ